MKKTNNTNYVRVIYFVSRLKSTGYKVYLSYISLYMSMFGYYNIK